MTYPSDVGRWHRHSVIPNGGGSAVFKTNTAQRRFIVRRVLWELATGQPSELQVVRIMVAYRLLLDVPTSLTLVAAGDLDVLVREGETLEMHVVNWANEPLELRTALGVSIGESERDFGLPPAPVNFGLRILQTVEPMYGPAQPSHTDPGLL